MLLPTDAKPARRASHSSSHHHGAADGEADEIFFEIPDFDVLAAAITDESMPIAKRMRSCFLLKQLGDLPSIEVLAKGLRSPSVLMAHECGYVLGQLQNQLALPFLRECLADRTLNPIVRHECAEAMGAIGAMESMEMLVEYSTDASQEVAETCQIAIEKLKWNAANPGVVFDSKYASVDPAPRTDDAAQSVDSLQKEMMDKTRTMFDRYRSMFALRDRGSTEAVLALATGFDDDSAVFRHEVAYVMGQIQHPAAVESLKKMLSNPQEHAMVRHEAAEALGSIATEEITPYLKTYQQDDKDRIVRESCDVALDLADYWTNDEVVTAVNPNQ
jgi:deoxyhypusine monooxygenase